MTPLQKLTRLAQIERLLKESPGPTVLRALYEERRDILASVGQPPAELVNSPDPGMWAHAFAETFPGVTVEQAFPWFHTAMAAAYDAGRAIGTTEALGQLNAGTQGLVDTLRLIRQGYENNRVRAAGLWHLMPKDGPGVPLHAFITRALKGAGLE